MELNDVSLVWVRDANRLGHFPPPAGAGKGGPLESSTGRWVWQEDKCRGPGWEKGSGVGEASETMGVGVGEDVRGSDIVLSLNDEGGGNKEGGEAVMTSGRCSKCSKKGHQAAACKTEVYCVICDSHEHMNHRCPLLKAPRPVAHAAGYAVMDLGFYHIPHPPLPRVKKDSKMARVSVVGGVLSGDQLIMQLRRIVPVKWNWELKVLGEGNFLTQFPSRTELQRSIAYGGADAKGEGVSAGTRLQFEEWQEKEEGFLLPKVWVRVSCIRQPLREFPILWAVGSLLGSTQTVDMETTRKNEFGRIMVAVLDPKLIPKKLDVVIGDHYFDLEFEVETRGYDENGEEVDIEWDDGGNEGDGEGKEQDPNSENGLFDDQACERNNKRAKRNEGGHGGGGLEKGSRSGKEAPVCKGHFLNEEKFLEFLKWKANKVIEVAVEKALEEASTKVAEEKEGSWEEEASATPEMRGDSSVGTKEEVQAMVVEVGVAVSQVEELEKGSSKLDSEERGMTVAQDIFADAKLVDVAMIPEVVLSPTRVSPRLAGVAAEHTLVRAERLVQSKNLECNKGNKSMVPSAFSSVSQAVDNLRAIGLGAGSSGSASFETNVQSLLEKDFSHVGHGAVLGTGETEVSDADSVES